MFPSPGSLRSLSLPRRGDDEPAKRGAVAAKADVSVADVKVHAVERPKPEGFG